MSIPIYCNNCGRLFPADTATRRFCSNGCTNRFWGENRRIEPLAPSATSQMAIVRALRATGDAWVERSDLLIALYGVADKASKTAFDTALGRLRRRLGGAGLVIRCRYDRATYERDRATYYRLEHDAETRVEMVS